MRVSGCRVVEERRYLDEAVADCGSHDKSKSDEAAVSHRRSIASLTGDAAAGTTTDSEVPPEQQAPIIVLQEAPIALHNRRQDDTSQPGLVQNVSSTRSLNPGNPRRNRMLRQRSDPDLFLSPQNLEDIVIHNAPASAPTQHRNCAESEPPWRK